MTITELLAKHGITIPAEKAKDFNNEFNNEFKPASDLTARDTEITGLKAQIKERDTDIKELRKQSGNSEELNTRLTELQTKYDTDTKALEKQMEDLRTDHAIDKFFAPIPFASELARKAAISEFREKKFKLEGDKFQGGEEFIASLKKSDPAAFKPENSTEGMGNGGKPENASLPYFTKSLNQEPPTAKGNPFNFNFNRLRSPSLQNQNQNQ